MVCYVAVVVAVKIVHNRQVIARRADSMARLLVVGSFLRLNRALGCMVVVAQHSLWMLVVTLLVQVLARDTRMVDMVLVVVVLLAMYVSTTLEMARQNVNNLDQPFDCKFNHYLSRFCAVIILSDYIAVYCIYIGYTLDFLH